MFTSNHAINIVLVDNGIVVDWGDHKEIYLCQPDELAKLIARIVGHFEGFYGAEFLKKSIDVKVRTKENWDDNEGI